MPGAEPRSGGTAGPTIEPTAPPVRMIGPSAPNGPPVPMLIALEMGFKMASRGCTRLPFDQDALHSFGDAVSADLLGPEAGHQPNDQAAAHRDYDGNGAKACWRWVKPGGRSAADSKKGW